MVAGGGSSWQCKSGGRSEDGRWDTPSPHNQGLLTLANPYFRSFAARSPDPPSSKGLLLAHITERFIRSSTHLFPTCRTEPPAKRW